MQNSTAQSVNLIRNEMPKVEELQKPCKFLQNDVYYFRVLVASMYKGKHASNRVNSVIFSVILNQRTR